LGDTAEQIYERILICRCQGGDEAALRELVAKYSPGLRFYLRKLTRNEHAADDLLQETWWDAYRKLAALQNRAAFGAWVYRIARDKAYRLLRRRPRETLETDGRLPDVVSADEAEFSAEDVDRVRRALDELQPEHREVIVLWFVEQMTYERIAAVIDRPVGTVRSRIHYAKLKLRELLTPLPSDGDRHERETIRQPAARPG
jgi:RNA polymerase sigma-70 factor (ECF subfamily)